MKKILILCMTATICITFATAQNKKSVSANSIQKEKTQQTESKKILDAIQNKKYKISVISASPMNGKTVYLTSPYSVKISNDSAYIELPYFGVAYSVPYGGGEGGIKAKNKYENYKLRAFKKGKYAVSFDIRGNEDFFKVSIDMWPSSGRAYIHVQPNNKQGISYNGNIVL